MKTRLLQTSKDADRLEAAVSRSADAALENLTKLKRGARGLHVLWAMKFHPSGCDPLDSATPLNLIEQLNQTFTYLATAKAVRLLFKLHPELAPFRVNLGTSPGSDIESKEGNGLAAEVFAAVNTSNNRKLERDLAKVAKARAQLKYVFFMCPGIKEGRMPGQRNESNVQVWSVGDAL